MNERIRKVNELILHALSSIVQDHSDGVIISVSGVETSRDLSYCNIFILSLDDYRNILKKLNDNKKSIRKELALKISLRKIPELRFLLDMSEVAAEKIDRLLNNI